MPPSPVSYHWLESKNNVINPQTFHNYNCDIDLPAGHTLRRILVSQPLFFWKRGSLTPDDQEIYFVTYSVSYGAFDESPKLFRTIRTVKETMVVNTITLENTYFSHHVGADLELGMNERVARGGFYSEAVKLRLQFNIASSGDGIETLEGQANMPFRALYSMS